jgi:hypothetical protein
VEQYHAGPPAAVRGCLALGCANGTLDLGTYASDFVRAVKDEGTGRITSGPQAGTYLNWSIDVGYWLDTAPRDARGQALVPYVSAAADPSIAFGTPFNVLACGVDDSTGSAADIDSRVCAQLQAANWLVQDRFTEGRVGQHLDLYIGEEDQPDFSNSSPKVISTKGATIALRG